MSYEGFGGYGIMYKYWKTAQQCAVGVAQGLENGLGYETNQF